MEKDFNAIEISLLKGFRENSSSIAYFIGDNSFPAFLKKFFDEMIVNLKQAMEDKDLTEVKDLENTLKRFFNELYKAAETRLMDYSLIEFFSDYLLLVSNYIKMIQQGNLYYFFKLDEKEVGEFASFIPELEDIIKLNLNTENLLHVTDELLKKAKQVLAGAPSNFKISDHFFKALKRNENDTGK